MSLSKTSKDILPTSMLVQFGMDENVGQKMICRTLSINPKKRFEQNVGEVIRLT